MSHWLKITHFVVYLHFQQIEIYEWHLNYKGVLDALEKEKEKTNAEKTDKL